MTHFWTGETTPQRIVALWFPFLPTERIMRLRHGRSWRSARTQTPPLVFSRQENNTRRIAALDEEARALGLRIGTGIAEAKALHPSIEVVESEPSADRALLDGLADWCDRYTPLVAIDGSDGLYLDITGCAHLFGGERTMLDDIMMRLFHQGFCVRAGLASTPGTAWAMARFGQGSAVEAGDEAEVLAPLPLKALRIEDATCRLIESVGLRTAGAILSVPRAPLVRRFGRQVTLRIDQALGHVREAIEPHLPVAPLSVERILAEPIVLQDDIEVLTAELARQLKADLERRGEGATRLQLDLFRVDGAVSRIVVGASRPLRDPRLVERLFRERLAAVGSDIEAGYGFDLVRLSVLVAAAYDIAQVEFDGSSADGAADLALFADRVRARLGDAAIARPILSQSHVPERASVNLPFAAGTAYASRDEAWPFTDNRPVRLLDRPECVEVTAAQVPEGPPSHFRWRRAGYRVARAEGPERIAPEWWREADDETRDYFRIEDGEGRRYWLYREGLYGTGENPPRWFMQGVFE